MSNELSTNEVGEAFAAIDAAYNAADVARDQAVKLRGHIDWLEEQVAERDGRIEELEHEVDSKQEQIAVQHERIQELESEVEDLSHPERA